MKEYVIWGIPPGENDEVLLVAQVGGDYIRDKKFAERAAAACRNRGATSVRVQEVDMETPPDFTKGDLTREG